MHKGRIPYDDKRLRRGKNNNQEGGFKKSLIISLLLFTAVISLMIFNIKYVSDTVSTMKELASDVRDGNQDSDTLVEYWNTRRTYLGFCVSFREIDKVSENVLCLKNARSEQSELMVKQSYLLLCDSLDDILRLEKIFI